MPVTNDPLAEKIDTPIVKNLLVPVVMWFQVYVDWFDLYPEPDA
jgi:hypothetical protein